MHQLGRCKNAEMAYPMKYSLGPRLCCGCTIRGTLTILQVLAMMSRVQCPVLFLGVFARSYRAQKRWESPTYCVSTMFRHNEKWV